MQTQGSENADGIQIKLNTSEDEQSELEAKAAWLKRKISKQITIFGKKKANNRAKAFALKILMAIFTVSITVLLGLKVDQGIKELYSNLALFLGGVITVLNAWDAFFNYRSLWVKYTMTTNRLHNLDADLDFLLASRAGSIKMDAMDNLFDRYQTILTETNEEWLGLRKEGAGKAPK